MKAVIKSALIVMLGTTYLAIHAPLGHAQSRDVCELLGSVYRGEFAQKRADYLRSREAWERKAAYTVNEVVNEFFGLLSEAEWKLLKDYREGRFTDYEVVLQRLEPKLEEAKKRHPYQCATQSFGYYRSCWGPKLEFSVPFGYEVGRIELEGYYDYNWMSYDANMNGYGDSMTSYRHKLMFGPPVGRSYLDGIKLPTASDLGQEALSKHKIDFTKLLPTPPPFGKVPEEEYLRKRFTETGALECSRILLPTIAPIRSVSTRTQGRSSAGAQAQAPASGRSNAASGRSP
jgi:hypothetical protein